jgi:hypothetical protein
MVEKESMWLEQKAKERKGTNFVKSVLEFAGYDIMDYGIENHNMDIVRKIKGSYKTETNQRLMCMPDFVVFDPDTKEAELIEVKYRGKPEYFNWKKSDFMFGYRNIKNYIDYWKDLTLIIVMNVKPFCLCIKMKDVDWNIHYRGKIKGQKKTDDEIWNFSGIYKLINDVFPRVKSEHFKKALEIVNIEQGFKK